jgi:hypothetical protein
VKNNQHWIGLFGDYLNSIGTSIESPKPGDSSELTGLFQQLASVLTELELLLTDLQSGISPSLMGYASDADVEELLEMYQMTISNLQQRIQSKLLAVKR